MAGPDAQEAAPWRADAHGCMDLDGTSGARDGMLRARGSHCTGLPAPILTANSPESGTADFGAAITDPPESRPVSDAADTPSLVETWVVHTRACEQKMGTDPWSSITVGRFDGPGVPLHGTPPERFWIEWPAGHRFFSFMVTAIAIVTRFKRR